MVTWLAFSVLNGYVVGFLMKRLALIATGWVNTLWRWFTSLKLTMVLLILISMGAILGMFFDQTITFDEFYRGRADDILTAGLSFFELYDAFHSWWFSLAILLLSLNLLACSIERLPRIYFDHKRPRPYLTRRRMLGLNLKERLKAQDYDQAQQQVRAFLKVPLDPARLPGSKDHFYCGRHEIGRFGVYVVHIALLIVMYSSIYATQNGVDGHVLIEEGGSARFITARGAGGVSYIHDLGFYIGCDDFRLRTFIDNSPMEFESDLYIVGDRDQGEKINRKTVRVNEPLSYAGFTFYQSSFKPIVSEPVFELEISDDDGFNRRVKTKLNTPIELPNDDVLQVTKAYEDFAGLGQALRIAKSSQDQESTYFHIFRKHKDYDRVVRDERYHIKFIESDQQYATGLSVGKVPGISIIFFGFMLLLTGLYMCFFMTPMRFFARIREMDGHFEVYFAACGFRNPQHSLEMFKKRMAGVKSLEKNEAGHA